MKNLFIVLIAFFLFHSCAPTVQKVGTVNIISHRNVDPNLQYELISSYTGGSKRELKKSRAANIQDAVDQTVRKVPGGEMVMNAKIYQVKGKYFAIEGDVWGMKGNRSIRGISVGDNVVCKDKNFIRKLDLKNDIIYGKVTGMMDDEKVYVKINGIEKTIKIPLDKITKSK